MADAVTTWGVGEYPVMAQRLRGAARRVVARARVAPGERVLDVACGTGNAALLAAQRGAADVIGVDVEPALLEVAAVRAAEVGAIIDWRVGDAQALPGVADGAFDAVVSVFGAMYAADQVRTARELARAAAPEGGRVVLASWTPGSFMPAMGAALAPFLPPPDGPPPSRWGDEETVRALLGGAGLEVVDAVAEHLVLALPDRMNAVAFLVRTAGNVLAERSRLEAQGRWGELLAALGGLVAQRDAGIDGRVALRCDYLLVEARPAPTPARA
ncbi:MAG TPA: class I SAM-dependent methyltransferase [Baekduia sp.]|nr:class I SAM-dependent methyltransferase [Baekduia sp.]